MDILELVHDDHCHENRPHICTHPACPKSFSRRSDLVRDHKNERPFTCPIPGCNKTFVQKSAQTVHIRTHTGEKPYGCEVCDKRFSDSSSLARHRRVHSGNRPYRCLFEGCGKSFARKMTLTKHTRRRHPGRQQPGRQATAAIPRTVKSQPTEAKVQSIGASISPYSPSSLALAMQGVTSSASSHPSGPPTPHRNPTSIQAGSSDYQNAPSHAYSASVPSVGYPASHMLPPAPYPAGSLAHGLYTTVNVHQMNRFDGHSRHLSSYFYPANDATYSSARMSPVSRAQQPGNSHSGTSASSTSISSASTPSPPSFEATTPTSAGFPLSLGSSAFYKESPTYSHYRSVSRSHGLAHLDYPFSAYSPQPLIRHGHTPNSSLSASIGQYEHRFRPMGPNPGP